MTQQRDTSAQPSVNLPELLVRVDNDRDLLRELIEIFQEDFPRRLQQLQTYVGQRDMNSVETASHGLKGMLSSLSAMRAAAAAARLEQMGREGKMAGLPEALAQFEQEVEGLLPELDGYMMEAKQ
ncbi:MAG TPA: Hpt domain-containing protein [Candidatus Dormibacteraeota bacterium]|nr:Hpt domain-containing protein [Candidatus Dormibacteraeota bacterium]